MAHRKGSGNAGLCVGAMLETHHWGKNNKIEFKDFTRMFRPNWGAIIADDRFGKTDLRVLICCSLNTTETNRVSLSQAEIATHLNLDTSAVSKAVRVLVRSGLLLQQGHSLHLNSRVAADQTSKALWGIREDEVDALHEMEAALEHAAQDKEDAHGEDEYPEGPLAPRTRTKRR